MNNNNNYSTDNMTGSTVCDWYSTSTVPEISRNQFFNNHPTEQGVYPYSATFLYLPESLDLAQVIQDNEETKPNGKRSKSKSKFFWHYAYIVSTVYISRYTNKKYGKDDYIPINVDTAREIISYRKCVGILRDLVSWGILECDYIRKYGMKSYGYRFPAGSLSYSDTFRRLEVKDKLLTKKINIFREKKRQETISAGEDFEHLDSNIRKVKVNYNEAMAYIDANYTPFTFDYDTRKCSVQMIHDKNYFCSVDRKGKRAHTNLTNLSSDLRQFLTFEGRKLGQVDLRNSQPFLLNLVIKNKINLGSQREAAEYNQYKKLTEQGKFYEFLMDKFGIDNKNEKARKDFKLLFFGRVFFDQNYPKLKKEEKLFKELFPTIFRIIREIKQDDYTRLAMKLQREESKIIINDCVRRIRKENPEMFVSTIHDSIVGELKNLDYFRDVIEDAFIKHNLQPTIKKEKF